jgi:hypothetical protein
MEATLPQPKPKCKRKVQYYMGTFKPEKIAETPSDQGSGYFSRSKFGLRRSTMPNSYNPNFMQLAEDLQIEILESHVPDSRLHAIINNPVTEGIDEG